MRMVSRVIAALLMALVCSAAFAGAPLTLPIPTDAPGSYYYSLRDAAGTELNRIPFEVYGEGSVSGRLARSAELAVTLARSDYAPGEEIELSIRAPYAGAGLITIERDRVYAARWFRAAGNSSVERIRVPQSLEGNGYVVVSFLRALDAHQCGETYREIARALFGATRVPAGSAWKTHDLRDRTIRLVRTGVRLMRGGYLGLLRYPQHRNFS